MQGIRGAMAPPPVYKKKKVVSVQQFKLLVLKYLYLAPLFQEIDKLTFETSKNFIIKPSVLSSLISWISFSLLCDVLCGV